MAGRSRTPLWFEDESMMSHIRVMVLALFVASVSFVSAVRSQATIPTPQLHPDSVVSAPDSAKHKHGMFGKLKGVAKNKTVQGVAKAAVCTAVPGGSMVVGAVDAHKSGGGASQIAQSAGSTPGCMPGVGGMGAGLNAKGVGSVGTATAMGMAAAQPGNAMQAAAMNGVIAKASATGAPTGGSPQSAAAMQALMVQMQAMQIQAQTQMAAGASAGMPTEAGGQQIQLSGTVADEIKKGKLVLKHIDWMRGSPGVSAPTTAGFIDLITSVGQAMKESGSSYRVDIYMDKQYSDADIAALAPQRLGMIIAALQDRVQIGDAVMPGNIKKDKEQRLEFVKIK